MTLVKPILALALLTAVSASQAFMVTKTDPRADDQSFATGSSGHRGDKTVKQGDDWDHHGPWGGMSPAVPEPGTYALMAAGLGVVGWIARRRRR